MIPRAKLKHRSLHPARAFRIFEPAFGAVAIAIFSEGVLIAVDSPGITSHQGAAGNELPADGSAGRWHDSFDHHPESGVHPESFLDASVEVGQFAGFGERGLEVG